ncbi:uncharacterized protein LOC135204519 [Macrobrachium nipponense]|uniref:uncharacterized protein LOC135204519 n=1 Tax=Macrobrachium nipponense TaxID=159736 RepID=UPI0030C8CAB0
MVKLNIEMARLQGANLVSSPKGNGRLVGKAIRVYNALEEGIARDYHKVKALVLKSYDLVPEAYRLKFRNYNKHPSQSYVEFARVKEEQFDDWLKSRQVVSFAALRELLLLEEFKKACSKELRVHLEEVKAMKLSSAAQLADEYVLTHRSGNGNFGYRVLNDPSSRAHSSGRRGEPPSSTPNIPKINNANSFSDGRNVGRVSGGSPPPRVFVNRGTSNSGNNQRYNNNNGNRSTGRRVTCFWCDKPGHFQNQCNARRRYLERNGQNAVSLISERSSSCDNQVEKSVVSSKVDNSSSDTSNKKQL